MHVLLVSNLTPCFISACISGDQIPNVVRKISIAAALLVSEDSYFILRNAESISTDPLSSELSETLRKS